MSQASREQPLAPRAPSHLEPRINPPPNFRPSLTTLPLNWVRTLALLMAGSLCASAARAADGPAAAFAVPSASYASPYAGQAPWHAVAAVGLYGVSALLAGAVAPALLQSAACSRVLGEEICDAQRLTAMDRWAMREASRPWRRVSDVGMWTGLAAPLLLPFVDRLGAIAAPTSRRAALQAAAEDLALGADLLALTTFVTDTVKFAVRRPRPINYLPGPQSVYGQLSFPSGHTAAAAAGMACITSTYRLRHPDRGHRWQRASLYGAGAAVVAITGFGRIAGAQHFLSDVLAGGLLGGAIGTLMPAAFGQQLHLVPLPGAVKDGGAGLGIVGQF